MKNFLLCRCLEKFLETFFLQRLIVLDRNITIYACGCDADVLASCHDWKIKPNDFWYLYACLAQRSAMLIDICSVFLAIMPGLLPVNGYYNVFLQMRSLTNGSFTFSWKKSRRKTTNETQIFPSENAAKLPYLAKIDPSKTEIEVLKRLED